MQSQTNSKPLVVVGSANADLVLKLDRVPAAGETLAAETLELHPGGKGANQAACAALLGHPTHFIGQLGNDSHGTFVHQALATRHVLLDHLAVLTDKTPTGTAVIMLEKQSGENRIIIVGGANTAPWHLSPAAEECIAHAGMLLLQREVPEEVNLHVARLARRHGVPVLLDAGGVDAPLGADLESLLDIFSPNETELARLTGLPTESESEVLRAVQVFLARGVPALLVKRGMKGSMLVTKNGDDAPNIVHQDIVRAPHVVDTTGAGDCFTATYAVAALQQHAQPLRVAATAASLCVRRMGAMSSMPTRAEVEQEMQLGDGK